jgi:hypothetical protein
MGGVKVHITLRDKRGLILNRNTIFHSNSEKVSKFAQEIVERDFLPLLKAGTRLTISEPEAA